MWVPLFVVVGLRHRCCIYTLDLQFNVPEWFMPLCLVRLNSVQTCNYASNIFDHYKEGMVGTQDKKWMQENGIHAMIA